MQVRVLSPPLHHHPSSSSNPSLPPSHVHCTRRSLFNSIPLLSFVFIGSSNSLDNSSAPVTPPTSPLVEQLLERSRANKAKNDQKRLDDYYERNYKDYFEFVEGTIRNKTDLTETEKGILRWLENYRNKKK